MRLKSPVRPTRGLTTLVAAGTVIVGFVGFAVTQGGPASADPHQVYTVVGSDTTQNVFDQFALDEGANLIGSWDALNPVSQVEGETITPNNAAGGQCSFTRPDGSGQGLNALLRSIDQNNQSAQLAIPPGPNCIDWARSSSGPGSNQTNTGVLVYIPFAIDAVTGVISSAAPSSFSTAANELTVAQLTTLYSTCGSVTTSNGTTFTPRSSTNPSAAFNITLYLPQTGSGTAKYWASVTGNWSLTSLPECVFTTIQAGASENDTVQENDGTSVTSDPTGYMPFSIAQYVAQTNGFGDNRLHSAVLAEITPNPTTANPSPTPVEPTVNGSLNTGFPFTREVYDIIPYDNVTSGQPGYNAQEAQLLAGTGSVLCRDVITITNYGFALLPSNSSTYDACGATTGNLRAFTTV